MRKGISILAIALLLLSGCTYTHFLTEESQDRFLREINKNSRNKGKVKTIDNRTFYTENIILTPDSLWWNEQNTGVPYSLSTSNVKEITFFKSKETIERGFVSGLLIGSLFGMVIGFIVESQVGSKACCFPIRDKTTPGFRETLVTAAIGGMIVGTGAGALSARNEKFVFHNQETDKIR